MTEDEIKEWDDALLDLISKGLIKPTTSKEGEIAFILLTEKES